MANAELLLARVQKKVSAKPSKISMRYDENKSA
jgi:hypothetical protein